MPALHHTAQGVSQGFAALLRKPAAPLPVPAACVVRIVAGMHRGATLRLRQPAVLGSAEECDLVLRDADVRPRHAELRRVDGRWGVYDLQDGHAIPAHETARRGAFLRQRHALGAAQIAISQALPLPAPQPPLRDAVARALAPVALVFALSASVIVMVQLVTPADARVMASSRTLAAEGLPDIEVLVAANTPTRVKGHVANSDQFRQLQQWMRQQGLSQANASVHVGTELVARVRDALADPALQVDYQPGGTVRVQGTSTSMALREHIRRLAADLAGVVRVDDQVAYVAEPERPRTFVLPMRIVDARPGTDETGGSFGTSTGERFFVGAVLPDGSEVIAIHEDSIEFSLAGRRIDYPLK